mmetsp:Transcript_19654/g.39845  ORF Transcript_19654/g.39845 Transcript_19654/m.39845 type:complete len:641 (+) Transcript_19654:1354-3276(+)|eukprot:CAMPEP_0178708804 /NCGR_PEP_ID=MMETSP0699-20121125/16838_1 /TAXON_ID=265572 /ORGANISM="Extubocellulus spinifer, Strain CCMP396" /LENGTH=640 /DNA_ID=CAMNT_0020357101 /DNA_START=1827 /DNA_END=3749 /DNA_ORIENTATION=+
MGNQASADERGPFSGSHVDVDDGLGTEEVVGTTGISASMRSLVDAVSLADERAEISSDHVPAGTASMRSLASEIDDARQVQSSDSSISVRRRRRADGGEDDPPVSSLSSTFIAQAFSTSVRSLDPSLADEEVQSLRRASDTDEAESNQQSSTPEPDGLGQATLTSSVINLLNTLAGVGLLALPSAFAKAGYVGGMILLILTAASSVLGMKLLTISIETTGVSADKPSSYNTVTSPSLPHLTWLVDAVVALKCLGVCILYLITVGDSMVDALTYLLRNFAKEGHFYEQILTSRHFWIGVAVVLVVPLVFQHTLDSLKFGSAFGIQLKVALILCIVLYALGIFDPCYIADEEENDEGATIAAADEYDGCKGDTNTFTDVQSSFIALSLFVNAFTYHQNCFPIANELRNRTQARMDQVIYLTTIIAMVLYGSVSIAGYITFGSNVEGNILLNYPQTALLTAMRIFVAAMVILSYPLQLDPARRSISGLLAVRRRLFGKGMPGANIDATQSFASLASEISCEDKTENLAVESSRDLSERKTTNVREENSANERTEKQELFEFRATTLLLLLLSFSVASITSDLGLAFAVIGASGSTLIMFIIPSMVYLSLHEKAVDKTMHFFALLQLTLGIVILPTSLYFIAVS